MAKDMRDKIRGSMIGGAVGDALGYQIEFETGVGAREVTRFAGEKGIISDDTQMTLFTACALLWRETRFNLRGIAATPADAVYLGYLDWLGTQQRVEEHTSVAWIKNLKELNILCDPGMTCIETLSSGKRGTLWNPINDSKGCGGIMRVAPVGLYLFPITRDKTVGEIAAETCAITHGHPLALLSAYVLAEMIFDLTNTDDEIIDAAKKAILEMNKWKAGKSGVNVRNKGELTELLNRAIELAESKVDDLQAISELGGGWVAEEALAIALYSAVKYPDNFEDAVVCAVNHDGDSDSTGAITGNIMGAKLGYEEIPEYYKNNVELKDVILELADDMADNVPLDKNGNISDEKWLEKYLYL